MTALFVFRRELRALLRLPHTWAIAAAYLIISGLFFVNILISTEIPDLAQYYSNIASTLLVLVPVVAMRSFAEERRSGALDITLSWQSSRRGLVLGKFAANTLFVAVISSIVWLYFGLIGNMASISAGRTAGGYIGLLLLATAFSALALMVSARAPSPTAAAFLGFGLLLFLWILQYAPGWLGHTLSSLGPASHFEAFSRGAIYWEDVAYFVVVTVVAVGLAVFALNWEGPGLRRSALVRRAAVLGAVMAMGAGGTALAGGIDGGFDLTSEGQNAITQTTRDVIGKVREPIRLTGFANPISSDVVRLRRLVQQYRAAGSDISLDVVDPDVQPGRARQAGVSGYGQTLVVVGDRREVLGDPTEARLTSAVNRLSRSSLGRACFTIGHGELDIADTSPVGASDLAGTLGAIAYEAKPIALGAAGAKGELARCSVVVVLGPRVPFLPGEISLLQGYARGDGRLLIMADAVEGPSEQLNQLLAPWGAILGRGPVNDVSALADDPSSVVSSDFPSASPVLRRLQQLKLPVVLTNAMAVEGDESAPEGLFTPLVRSSERSWIDRSGERAPGPFDLAALVDRSRLTGEGEQAVVARTRIGIVGSADMASNRLAAVLGNREFLTSLVQWVALEDDLIAAGAPPTGFFKLVLTDGQRDRLVKRAVAFPALGVLVPMPFVVLRLKTRMSGAVVRYGASAVIVFVGAVLGAGFLKSDEHAKEPVPSVLSLDPPAVLRVAITSERSRVELFRRPDGTWTAGSGGSPEAAELMAHLEGRLFPLLGYRSLPVAATNPEFGLAAPALVLDVEAIGGRRRTVSFGDPTFNTGGVYAGSPTESAQVFLVPRRVAEDLRSIVAGRVLASAEPSLADRLNDRINKPTREQPGTLSPWLRQVLDSGVDVPAGLS